MTLALRCLDFVDLATADWCRMCTKTERNSKAGLAM